ncbi:thrombospondin type 3 repeat-containing protein [Patescibacteria group bacterium]|nr:thrombospondin type 3 repeat-containing protein [Patescibacteria group bacterium]
MQYLPSKKLLAIIVAVLIVAGGWFLVFQVNNSGNNNGNSSEGLNYISNLFKDKEKDSDNDGLKDWEETLWKTDPNNSDTDGDGTADGEEIKQSRDPAKPGPDDKLNEFKNLIAEKENNSDINGLTITDQLARQFFASFMALYQSGSLDEETKSQMADSLAENLSQERLSDKYTVFDLNIINDNSKEAIKIYGDKTQSIIDKYQANGGEDEITIINNAFQNEDNKELQKLDATIILYRNVYKELLKVEAPSSLAGYHLDLINGIYNLAESLVKIEETFNDPIGGLVGVNQYQEAYLQTRRAMANIGRYLTK